MICQACKNETKPRAFTHKDGLAFGGYYLADGESVFVCRSGDPAIRSELTLSELERRVAIGWWKEISVPVAEVQ